MKTKDFMSALGGIDERYLKDMLEADAAPAAGEPVSVPEITVTNRGERQAVPVSGQQTGFGRTGSGIFRYLILAASAAACIGGVSLLVMLGKQKPDDLFRDSEPVEVSEITAAVTSADPAAESGGSVTTYTTAAGSPETSAPAKNAGQKTEQTALQTTAAPGQTAPQDQTAAKISARTGQTTTAARATTAPAKRTAAEVPENNVTVRLYDWACESEYRTGSLGTGGILRISTKDGKTVYEESDLTQFTLPDGEYHVDIRQTDQPSHLIDPDSDFAAYVRGRHPGVVFTDQSGGIDFAVIDGRPDRELQFDFGPCNGMCNFIKVCCADAAGMQPLAGVQFTLIEEPETYAKVIGTGISGADGTYTFSGLLHAGSGNKPPYLVRIDSVPAGVTGGFDAEVSTGPYITGTEYSVRYVFTQDSIPKNVSAVIYDVDDEGKELGDIASYEVWMIDENYTEGSGVAVNTYCVCKSVLPSEKIALADGAYFATVHSDDAHKNGYKFTEKVSDEMRSSTFMEFKVKDGKPDREIAFYLEKIPDSERYMYSDMYSGMRTDAG